MKWFKRLSRESSVNLNDKLEQTVLVNEAATLRINESHDICSCGISSVKNDNENDICCLCRKSNNSESIMKYNNSDKLDKISLLSASSAFASPGARAEESVTLNSAASTTITTHMEDEFMHENSNIDTDADADDDDDVVGKNNDSKLKKSVVSFDNKLSGVRCRLFKCKLCLKQKEEHDKEISNTHVPTTEVIQIRVNEIASPIASSFLSNHDTNITYKITTNKCSRNNIKFCEIKKVKRDCDHNVRIVNLSDGGLRKRVKNLESIILLSDGDSSSLSSAASSLSSTTSAASTSGAVLSCSHRSSTITTINSINSRNSSIPFEDIRSSLLPKQEQQVESDSILREIIDPDDFFDDPDEVNKYLEEQILSEWEFIDCPILKKKTDTIKGKEDDLNNVDGDDDDILNISCHSFTSSNFDNLLFESSSDSETTTTSRSSSSAEGNLADDHNKNSDNDDSFDCSSYEKIGRSPSVLSLRSYEEDTFGLFYLCDSTIFRLSEASYYTTSYLFEKDICNGLSIDYFNDIVIEEDIYYAESVDHDKDANAISCNVKNNSAALFFKQTGSHNLLSANTEDLVQTCRVNAFAYSLMGPLLVQDKYYDPLILLEGSELKEQNTATLSSASADRQTELQEISEEDLISKVISSRNTNNNNSNSTFCIQHHFGLNDSGDIVIHLDHIIVIQGYTMPLKKCIKQHMKHIPKGIEVFEEQKIQINWRKIYNGIIAYLCENIFGKYSIISEKDFIIHYILLYRLELHYISINIYFSLFLHSK